MQKRRKQPNVKISFVSYVERHFRYNHNNALAGL